MKIDLTKSQCESLIDFIELNLMDVIRKDKDIDSLEWVQNIITANTLFHLAIAGSEKPQEMPKEAPDELTENEMADAIAEVCGNNPVCHECPLIMIPGKCYTEGADIKKNYRIMKEAGLFDQKDEG
jgi:hypothetical protein